MTIISHTRDRVKGVTKLISYAPLWETMKKKGVSTYVLRNKGGFDSIGGATMLRLQAGESVSTNTINSLCKILNCKIEEVVQYIPEEEPE